MREQIQFRSYQKKDFVTLSKIIGDTWKHEKFCNSPRLANKLSDTYLYFCLAEQTFSQVALINQEPVGIIMGNVLRHRQPVRYKIAAEWSAFCLSQKKEGKAAWEFFKEVDKIDQEILKETGKEYQGELSFFAVSSKHRGKGIGKVLFQTLCEYMKQENVANFYVFTDTSCNYRFYELQGMKKRGERHKSFRIGEEKVSYTFFIYDQSEGMEE